MKIPTRSRYRKRIGAFSAVDVKHDESVVSFSTAAEFYNFDMSSGSLRDGYGLELNKLVPVSSSGYWVYRYYSEEAGRNVDQYVYQTVMGALRYYDSYTGRTKLISTTSYPPIDALNYRLNGKDVLLMSCEGHRLLTWDGAALVEHAETPVITSMALHYERLFVTSRSDPTKVFFSDDLDPTNWTASATEGGFIELLDERGELNKVVSFANYLYIFRDRGISRVTAYADQTEFSVANLFVSAGRIYPESIAKCGTVITFLASDGLYVFDGYECRRVLRELDGLFTDRAVACAFHNGKYFLSCVMDFADGLSIGCESVEHTANALLVFDPVSGEYSITRGVDIGFLGSCSFDGTDFLMAHDKLSSGVVVRNGMRFNKLLPKRWRGPMTDFGAPDMTKAVREIYVDSATDCALTVDVGKKIKTKTAAAGSRRVRFNVAAKRLSLAIDCDASDCNIAPPTLVYTSY